MGEMPLVQAKSACVRVPLDGGKLIVMINFQNGEQKTLPAARRPAAPLSKSRQKRSREGAEML